MVAFSSEPMRVDGSLQKAFMRSVKPAPFNKDSKDTASAKVTDKEKIADKGSREETKKMPSIEVPVTPKIMNPAADLFVKSAVETNLQEFAPRICVVGVGGGGCNAINNMVARGLSGVEFICTNTDAQHLSTTLTDKRIQLGRTFTEGLGCGKFKQSLDLL